MGGKEMSMKLKRLTIAAVVVMAMSTIYGSARADDWATIVANAKKEGVVAVHGMPGKNYHQAMVPAFNKYYPDIKVKFSSAAASSEVPKVLRERQAGIYEWDVWLGGSSSALGPLKNAGFFQTLRPILRPEIMADDKWIDGFDGGWLDSDKKIFYAYDGTIQNPVMVNWDFVKKDSIKNLSDLAKPEFAGKIVAFDPRVAGTGVGTSQTLYHNLGKEGLIAIYKNDVAFTSSARQLMEWLVRGRYPIGLAYDHQELAQFRANGLGLNIGPLDDHIYKIRQITPGYGNLGLVDKAPHPNAAAVYINWLLSKEGQEEWVKVPRASRRTDVVPTVPELSPKPGLAYFNGYAEELTKERRQMAAIAKEAIDGEVSRTAPTK
jgi:iron(III) transport system substrate-binding protein